jgi:two-component sensor histidine kinase
MKGFFMEKREELEARIRALESELSQLRLQLIQESSHTRTVQVPDDVEEIFANIEKKVAEYFSQFQYDPESGEITVYGERYVLFRSGSVSHEFIQFIQERYRDYSPGEAISIGNNFLYDNAKVIGQKDAAAFHKRLKLQDPIEKLSAGPVHFAFTGWANVEIFHDSRPVADEHFILRFQHHNSFEAQSWIKAGKRSEIPVCTMNCGYSAGWCEESFGIPLTTVEITCEAKGDPECTFIMAPPDKIEAYVGEAMDTEAMKNVEIPVFFKRIHNEQRLKDSLHQKELLIREIHHRVKNNLQIITSLLRLQMHTMKDARMREEFESSINRIKAMATVHELMYHSEEFERFKMDSYFKELIWSLVKLYAAKDEVNVDIQVNVGNHALDLESSIPLALIMNEITCNAFKHGIPAGGAFYLHLREENQTLHLTIGDNGGGMHETPSEEGLGMSLIQILCNQLNATLEMDNGSGGLEYRISLALPS